MELFVHDRYLHILDTNRHKHKLTDTVKYVLDNVSCVILMAHISLVSPASPICHHISTVFNDIQPIRIIANSQFLRRSKNLNTR